MKVSHAKKSTPKRKPVKKSSIVKPSQMNENISTFDLLEVDDDGQSYLENTIDSETVKLGCAFCHQHLLRNLN